MFNLVVSLLSLINNVLKEARMNILERLEKTIEQDKQWTPTIIMNLDSPNNPHDIVPYLNPTEMDKTVFMSKRYPQKAYFLFYGFQGIGMKNDLVNDLKKAALKDGTTLNFRSRGKNEHSPFTYYRDYVWKTSNVKIVEMLLQRGLYPTMWYYYST